MSSESGHKSRHTEGLPSFSHHNELHSYNGNDDKVAVMTELQRHETIDSVVYNKNKRGVNPGIVARQSRRSSAGLGVGDEDDDDASVNGYIQYGATLIGNSARNNNSDMYGYASSHSRQQMMSRSHHTTYKQSRRPSNASSVQSRSSRASRRRSTGFRDKSKDPLAVAGFYPPRGRVATSRKINNDSEIDSISSADEAVPGAVQSFGYESDQVSDSELSTSTSKRSKRRNSCIISTSSFAQLDGGLLSNRAIESSVLTQNHDASDSDDDPNSLLNRAVRGNSNKVKAAVSGSDAAKQGKTFTALQNNDSHEATDEEDIKLLYENHEHHEQQLPRNKDYDRRIIGADVLPKNGQIPTEAAQAWRSSPLTTPFAAPTEDYLKESFHHKGMLPATGEPEARRDGWGDLDLQKYPSGDHSSSPPESSEMKSEQSYGASMYKETKAYQETDAYQQKARRRASLESTCVDISNFAANHKKSKVPNFKPADGCHNASDFVVRCFTARLRTSGFAVIKHNRSRWSKAKNRVIYLLPDGKTLSWRVVEEEKDKAGDAKMPKIVLSSCIEVRHALSPDPSRKNKKGTSVLRSRCKNELAGRSFSLIFGKRSLDFTAFSNDQCKILIEGFSALCFRLQLQGLEEKDDHSSRVPISEDDWCASTIYGESSGVSNANSPASHHLASTPWGY